MFALYADDTAFLVKNKTCRLALCN